MAPPKGGHRCSRRPQIGWAISGQMSLLPCSPGEFPALGGNLGREGLRTHPLWLSPAPPPPQEGRKGCGNLHSRAQAAALLRCLGSRRGQCCPQFDSQNHVTPWFVVAFTCTPQNTLPNKLFRALGCLRPLFLWLCCVSLLWARALTRCCC